MNTKELLETADKVVYESTGRHLTDLQSDLLKASYENQTYEQFANEHGYCLDYIKKDVGSVLWNLLSLGLGEKITKKNFRQALERYKQAQEILNYKEKERKKRNDNILMIYLISRLSWEAQKNSASLDNGYYKINVE